MKTRCGDRPPLSKPAPGRGGYLSVDAPARRSSWPGGRETCSTPVACWRSCKDPSAPHTPGPQRLRHGIETPRLAPRGRQSAGGHADAPLVPLGVATSMSRSCLRRLPASTPTKIARIFVEAASSPSRDHSIHHGSPLKILKACLSPGFSTRERSPTCPPGVGMAVKTTINTAKEHRSGAPSNVDSSRHRQGHSPGGSPSPLNAGDHSRP